MRERRRRIHRREQAGVEGAVEGGAGDHVQPLHPDGRHAAGSRRPPTAGRGAGTRDLLARDGERAPEFGADPVTDHRRLRAVPPALMIDQAAAS